MRHSKASLAIQRRLVGISLAVACLTTVAFGVDKDKALYVGGTLKEFAPPPISRSEAVAGVLFGGVAPPPKIEGRINLTSDTAFGFEAGRRGSLLVPYHAIVSLEYGLETGHRVPTGRGLLLVMPWDPTEQFTKNAHNLLTVVYKDSEAVDQAIVLELGRDLVRLTLQTLERRTGKDIEFLNVEACMLFKNDAEACAYGQPTELKGLTKVFLDNRIAPDHRKLILSEIEKGNAGLEIADTPDRAHVVLGFRAERSLESSCPCEAGRGEVWLVRADRRRIVLVFTGMKRGVWGSNPAVNFARTVVEAFRRANGVPQRQG